MGSLRPSGGFPQQAQTFKAGPIGLLLCDEMTHPAVGPLLARIGFATRHRGLGITSNVSTVELTMPPIIGAAIRFITSAPVPVLHMIGSNPPIIAATVIILGRTRWTAPSMMAWCRS